MVALAIAAISMADLVPSRNELNICEFMPAAAEIWGIEERVMWSIHLANCTDGFCIVYHCMYIIIPFHLLVPHTTSHTSHLLYRLCCLLNYSTGG